MARYIVFQGTPGQSYVADRVGRGISEVYLTPKAIDLASWLNDRDAGYQPRLPGLCRSPLAARPNCKGPCCRKPPKRARRG